MQIKLLFRLPRLQLKMIERKTNVYKKPIPISIYITKEDRIK